MFPLIYLSLTFNFFLRIMLFAFTWPRLINLSITKLNRYREYYLNFWQVKFFHFYCHIYLTYIKCMGNPSGYKLIYFWKNPVIFEISIKLQVLITQKLFPVLFHLRNFLDCKINRRKLKNVIHFPHLRKVCDCEKEAPDKRHLLLWFYVLNQFFLNGIYFLNNYQIIK